MLIAGVVLIPAVVLAVVAEIGRNDSASRGLGGMNVTAATWATVGFFFLRGAIATAGYLARVVAWIGAAFNTTAC